MRLTGPQLGLKTTSITHFTSNTSVLNNQEDYNYEYVLDCKIMCHRTTFAIALSDYSIQIRERDSFNILSEFIAHNGTINELCPSNINPWKLGSCSSDKSIKLWDLRTNSLGQVFNCGDNVWSMSFNVDEYVIAAGLNNTVGFYDTRNGKKIKEYSESHLDAVTRVRFHPTLNNYVVTASEDGIVCLFDCSITDEEDSVESIINAESCISQIGFFGSKMEGVYCLTCTETLDLWNLSTAERFVHYPNAREYCSKLGTPIDYLVDCRYDSDLDALYLVGGSHDGDLNLYTVSPNSIMHAGSLVGGHKSTVRCLDWDDQSMITGGEDSRISIWENNPVEKSSGGSNPIRSDTSKKRRSRIYPY